MILVMNIMLSLLTLSFLKRVCNNKKNSTELSKRSFKMNHMSLSKLFFLFNKELHDQIVGYINGRID